MKTAACAMSRYSPRRVVLLATPLVLALVAAQSTGTGSCTETHIFLSRGNNEPYPGRQGKLVEAICSGLSSCDYEDIVFDNALETEYCGAVEAGRKAGVDQITAYAKKCPDAKLVVSGYSQGAHVMGDVLGGGGGTFFQGCTTPAAKGLDAGSAPGNKIECDRYFIYYLIHYFNRYPVLEFYDCVKFNSIEHGNYINSIGVRQLYIYVYIFSHNLDAAPGSY
ncbi:hypothetical protein ABKA04_004699 [Annulohypoxylon sp. FPYF3050]